MLNFDPKTLEMKNSASVAGWGRTIVFAPHPDDESLGCGGVIGLLRKHEISVCVVTMSDGTLSHPNSKKFPAEKLRDIREMEMRNALEILRVGAAEISFLRYHDRSVPNRTSTDFDSAVKRIGTIIESENPSTVLVPWRRDPHPDHQATWQIVRAALDKIDFKIRVIEYPIWLWELAEEKDLPDDEQISLWRLDISEVLEIKQKAIHAHASQTTDLIDDDPHGFRLSLEILNHFAAPYEVFLEEIQ